MLQRENNDKIVPYIAYLKNLRVLGFYVSPNIYGLLVLLLSYILFYNKKHFLIYFSAIFLIMLFLTKSFNLVIFFIVVLALFYRKKWYITLSVGLIIVIFLIVFVRERDVLRINRMNPVIMRLKNIKAGIKMFLKKPLWGWGPFSYGVIYDKFKDKDANYVKFAHNIVVQHMADGGIIFLILFFYLLYDIFRKLNYYEAIPIIAIFIHNLFSFSLYSSPVIIICLLIIYGNLIFKNNNVS